MLETNLTGKKGSIWMGQINLNSANEKTTHEPYDKQVAIS